MALLEAAGLSLAQGKVLAGAIAQLPDVDLVILGGDRWNGRQPLLEFAARLRCADRVHFPGGVPSARRIDYLEQADVGLALADDEHQRDGLPASDMFEMLGIPFVTVPRRGDAEPLRAAIVEAGEGGLIPTMADGDRLLEALIVDLVETVESQQSALGIRMSPRSDGTVGIASTDGATVDVLVERAKRLRGEGDTAGAVALYRRVAVEFQDSVGIATAAAGLARLDARDEAWEAIERVMAAAQRPPLATVRAGEAAAVLGDLVRARACAEEVVGDSDASNAALRNAIRVLEQAGEPRAALGLARRIGDEPGIARIEGTLGSYDPSWLPRGGDLRPTPSPKPGRSLALLETSLPYVRSGYTYRAQTLLRAQRQAGVEPIVLTRLGFPATRGFSAPPREEVDGLLHHRADLPGVKQYTSVPITEQLAENVRWAVGVAREHRPEGIVAATPHLNGLVGLALRRELGIPLIYDVRGFPEMTWAVRRGGSDTDAFGLRRVAETRCMREADLVITLSETMRRHIVGRGVAAHRVHVLPHAVDTDAFAPRERDRELAVSLGLGARPVVGYISSLVPYEGVETLVEAIALARRSNPEIAGVIVGDGELLPSLEAQATRLGLDGHVVFTGRVEASEVMRYYSLTDVFVCPRQDHEVTRYVTPLKPFEAMAAGSCIAVSDLPTLREAVRDGECGALFAAGDAAALARTIVDLVERPERRRALEGAAREHVLANHGFDTLCSRFAEVWAELRQRSEAVAA
jgi:glycosyltransferase involved in cell wall biosynthesis